MAGGITSGQEHKNIMPPETPSGKSGKSGPREDREMKTSSRSRKDVQTRHPEPAKQKSLELSARAEHATGADRERLIRKAAQKAG